MPNRERDTKSKRAMPSTLFITVSCIVLGLGYLRYAISSGPPANAADWELDLVIGFLMGFAIGVVVANEIWSRFVGKTLDETRRLHESFKHLLGEPDNGHLRATSHLAQAIEVLKDWLKK